MMFITSDTLAFGRRLSMIARSDVEALGQRARAHHAADVGRHHHQVVVALLPDVAEQDGRGVDVVHRDVEEALDLVGVQVDRQHALHADGLQHVGHHLGGDRTRAERGTAVLAGVAEIGDRGGDAPGRGALQRIDHHHQFHQVVVGRVAGRLQDEDVAAAHVLEDLDTHLAVGERPTLARPSEMFRRLTTSAAKLGVGVAGEHHQAVVGHVVMCYCRASGAFRLLPGSRR
jgi:hypothetical protein